ncbi:MAG: hypothetical protein JWO90_715, partial [Solirubrobacterales bacterium]|nr:hypothetical protein [Solirubrobacterales bacterium]
SAPTGTRATVATPAARKPAARKPALRCKRGTVRIKGRRIVRCVRATTRRS